MDNEHSKNTDQEHLIDKIRAILYCEASKDYKKMDDDLIAECADYLMELENRKPLTNEEIDKAIKHIFEKGKPSFRRKRILKKLLWAAIISVLIFVMAISATHGQDDALEHFKQWGKTVFSMFSGERIESGNKTIIKNGNYSVRYDTVDELFENEDLDILYPAALPNGEEFMCISYLIETNGKSVTYSRNNPLYSIVVENFSTVSMYIDIETSSTETINNINCHYIQISDVDNYFYCAFEHNGFTYRFGAFTYEEMVFIINNLKEYQP
ncbi:MAG: hypothetical protein IJE74_00445 [Clostridia bacterium]|nr:hypothetical protein [Clostridia bacterium]